MAGLAPNVPLLIDPDEEAIVLIKSLDPGIHWRTVHSDSSSIAEDIMASLDNNGKVIVELRNLATYNQVLHDIVMHFQAAYLEASDDPLLSTESGGPGLQAGWTIEDKSLFFYTRDPEFKGNDWTNGIHTTVGFGPDPCAFYSRLESIVLHAVSPGLDRDHRQTKGELERLRNEKGRAASSLVAFIAEVCLMLLVVPVC